MILPSQASWEVKFDKKTFGKDVGTEHFLKDCFFGWMGADVTSQNIGVFLFKRNTNVAKEWWIDGDCVSRFRSFKSQLDFC